MRYEALELGRAIAGRSQVLADPEQPIPELHRPAGGIEAVAILVVAGDNRRNGLQMGIVQQCDFPLHNAEIRAADHPDFTVRPGLRGDPVERVIAVEALLRKRAEYAVRAVAAADVLDHDGVAAIDESLVPRRKLETFSIRRANE